MLFRFGGRCVVEVQAFAIETGAGTVLDIRASVHPVGQWRIMPCWPVSCGGCSAALGDSSEAGDVQEKSWRGIERP